MLITMRKPLTTLPPILLFGVLTTGAVRRGPLFQGAMRAVRPVFESLKQPLNSKSFGTLGRPGVITRKPISISSRFTYAIGLGLFDHT